VQVSNTWSSSPVCLFSVDYTEADGSSTGTDKCDTNDNVRPGVVAEYNVLCAADGFAYLDIFVQDDIFSADDVVDSVPGRCSPLQAGSSTVSYEVRIPCAFEGDECEDTPAPLCAGSDLDMPVTSEMFEDSESATWLYGTENFVEDTNCLAVMGGQVETTKTYAVPEDSSALLVSFQFYELSDIPDMELRIQNTAIKLGAFAQGTLENAVMKEGYFGDIWATAEGKTATKNKVTLVIPASWYPGGFLSVGFKPDACIDRFTVTAVCRQTSSPTLAPTASPSGGPTASPTSSPTGTPTSSPTGGPTTSPTSAPSGGPTHAPTRRPSGGPTSAPTASPSAGPTASPTSSPSAGPTSSPSEAPVAAVTTECVEITTASEYYHWGDYLPTGWPNDAPIIITGRYGTHVEFQINQQWKDDTVSWVATEYLVSSANDEYACPKVNEVPPGPMVSQNGDPITHYAECVDGMADVRVYIHDGSFDTDGTYPVPQLCEPSNDVGRKIAFMYEVPCKVQGDCYTVFTGSSAPTRAPTTDRPTTSPGTTMAPTVACPSDPELIGMLGESQFMYDQLPIEITSKNGDTVEYTVHQTWKSHPDSISWLATEYRDAADGQYKCSKEEEVSYGPAISLTSICVDGFATVNLYVHDGSFKEQPNIVTPGYCSPSQDDGKKVAFFFKVPCSDDCIPTPPDCPCVCSSLQGSLSAETDWQYPGFPATSLSTSADPAFERLNGPSRNHEAIPCLGLAESALKPRIATSCKSSDTVYYLVQDSYNSAAGSAKLTALKLESGVWSYMGGNRYLQYDDGSNSDISVTDSPTWQLYDLQARGSDVCMSVLNDAGSVLVYCFDSFAQEWKEVGGSKRIGVAKAVGDIELHMPSECDCPQLAGYMYVVVGRADDGHLNTDVANHAVVWYYNEAEPAEGWRPLGGDSSNASIIGTNTRNAHLAFPTAGNFACLPHAVVSDAATDVLSFSRFNPSSTDLPAGYDDGVWEKLDDITYSNAYPNAAATSALESVNDFVFTESGIPAIGWADNGNNNFGYLSVWMDYPSADATATGGFEVASSMTGKNGAIPPLYGGGVDDMPAYNSPKGMSIDAYGDAVFVSITDDGSAGASGAGKKVHISYINLKAESSVSDCIWAEYSTEMADLLPQDQNGDCTDGLVTSTNGNAHSHIKVSCNGDIYVGHIIAKDSGPLNVASLAKNGLPDLSSAAAAAGNAAAGGVCTDEVVANESFSNGEASTWSTPSGSPGVMTTEAGFGDFLGRLTDTVSELKKTFYIPSGHDTVEVEFVFYEIDNMLSAKDDFYVSIDGKYMKLNYFAETTASGFFDGVSVTTTGDAASHIGFDYSSTDDKFYTKLQIPSAWYPNGELDISFKLNIGQNRADQKQCGIDDVKVTAKCPTARRREEALGEEGFPTGASSGGADGAFYCSGKDYPCGEEDGMVNVCHYSARTGYQTYCVPEADSEILRFYTHDYCGPCVQGFGGASAE